MKDHSSAKKYQIFFLCTTIAVISFAFIHSLMPADMSGEESGKVLKILRDILSALHINPESINGYTIRKLAHYTEYFCLGISMTFCAYFSNVEKPLQYLFRVLFCGVLTPLIDETIQLHTSGRAGLITDVWLDFSGVLTGITAVLIALCTIKQLRKRKKSPERSER